jgi:hypothetical protein
MTSKIKLYRASSLHDRLVYDGALFDQVCVHWSVSGRRHPAFPYRRLITDYDGLSKRGRRNTEDLIDGFFSENELSQLREYVLRCHGPLVESSEIDLPIHASEDMLGMPGRPGDGVWRLYDEDEYSLPVTVSGDFHVDTNSPSAFEVTGDQVEFGTSYLRSAAKHLDLQAERSDEQRLAAVARKLGESGLVVTDLAAQTNDDDDFFSVLGQCRSRPMKTCTAWRGGHHGHWQDPRRLRRRAKSGSGVGL